MTKPILVQPDGFDFRDWVPITKGYGNYATPPDDSGVYVIYAFKIELVDLYPYMTITPLYIGSAKNLATRTKKHEVFRVLLKDYPNADLGFRQVNNYIEEERRLIKLLQPRYNSRGK